MLISNQEIIIRLLLATAIGCMLGFERRRHQKPVGMRTHVLICVAACLLTMVSAYGFYFETTPIRYSYDPARLVVGIMTGIGFIGAGIIWKSPNGSVQGITTAAEILLLAVIGITLGLGLYFPAVIAAIIALVTLMANSISTRIKNKKSAKLAAKSTSDHNTATEDQATPIQKLDNSH